MFKKKELMMVLILVIYIVFVALSFFNPIKLLSESSSDNTTTENYTNTTTVSVTINTQPTDIVNQSVSTITETETVILPTTITNILIHTTTLTLMATVPGGVPINIAFVSVALVGALSILVGYSIGYRVSKKPVEERPTTRRQRK
ncbi:MAG: hypothetical protein QW775_03495 [Ignisphaera sp.]|uniref:Uncharacterized protein n=1 Tax=Ignisphaera aggregans TaxID=334771 RepID=A0A7C4NLM0_9CREN